MATTATTTIYAFLDDTALHRRTRGMGALADKDQGFMYMDDQMVNYFVEPSTIVDRRANRLVAISTDSSEVAPNDPLLGDTSRTGRPDGVMSLHFDGTKIGSTDLSAATLTDAELKYLFNIIEYCVYSQNVNGVLPTAATMNAIVNANHDTYGTNVYLTGSLKVSADVLGTDTDVRTRVTLTNENIDSYRNTTFLPIGSSTPVTLTVDNREDYLNKTGYIISSAPIEMYFNGMADPFNPMLRTWIEFEVNLSNDQIVCFHIFLSREAFLNNYPYSNITNIVYPCDPALLRSLSDADNVADILSEASSYLMNEYGIPNPVRETDHSGVSVFLCQYINNVIGNGQGQYNLYFGAMYKGAVPSSDEVRIAIKEDLLKKTGTVDEDWMDILPDLFASATFMIVPIWHHFVDNGSGTIIPSQAYGYTMFKDVIRAVYPNYLEENIDKYLEVLPNSVSSILLLSIPSTDNAAQYRKLREIHPTYMALPNGDVNVNKQSSVTRAFAEQLNDKLGALISFNPTEGNPQPAGAKLYNGSMSVSFTVDGITYYILTRQSYPSNQFGM